MPEIPRKYLAGFILCIVTYACARIFNIINTMFKPIWGEQQRSGFCNSQLGTHRHVSIHDNVIDISSVIMKAAKAAFIITPEIPWKYLAGFNTIFSYVRVYSILKIHCLNPSGGEQRWRSGLA